MSDETSALQFEMMLVMRHLNHLQRHADWEEAPLDRSAYVLMSRISVDGPLTIRELREVLGLDDSTLNRQTAAIVRAGHLERTPDPDGGVARKFRLTEAGRKRLADERDSYARELGGVVDGWSPADRAGLIATLRRFNEAYEATEARPWARPAV
ncbi:MarR family winged helix-turn-helix transcriptional regulator [Microbacterium gorillae]|uniref:MarR family winged helix-turn-helix transcriptional regulator n=1 Tax=Microbacterium gorillae TaxID=1231063 RepID=UPI00058D6F43|nr:MarR family winged helix-turn-helix transcriptional regulator [Microbacterium gorillae]